MSHPVYTLLLALLLAGAISLEGRRPARERVYAGLYWFASLIAGVFAAAWAMRWIHG